MALQRKAKQSRADKRIAPLSQGVVDGVFGLQMHGKAFQGRARNLKELHLLITVGRMEFLGTSKAMQGKALQSNAKICRVHLGGLHHVFNETN